MAYWFVRLGRKTEPANQALYEGFADKYSLVKIGYGITKDITDCKSSNEIKKYITGKSDRSLAARARLVNQFINEIQIGDTIICPIGNHTNKVRMGKVISDCHAIGTFFEDREEELENFIAEFQGAREPENAKYKPAREVEWASKAVNLNDLPKYIQTALARTMRATVTHLSDEEIDTNKEYRKEKLPTVMRAMTTPPDYLSKISSFLGWFIRFLEKFGEWLVPIIISAVVSSIMSFLLYEKRENIFMWWEETWIFEILDIIFSWLFDNWQITMPITLFLLGVMLGLFMNSSMGRYSWFRFKTWFMSFMEWCYCGGCGCCRLCSKKD